MKKTIVKQNPEKELPTEVLAESILAISQGVKKLRAGRLTDRALLLLIQDAAPNVGGKFGTTKISMKEIRAVFEGIESLERAFIKKRPA